MIVSSALALFGLAAAAASYRLVRGPALADRVMALDAVLICAMCALATFAADQREVTYLGGIAVIAIVGFTATVVVARFIESEEDPA